MRQLVVTAAMLCASIAGAQGVSVVIGISAAPGFGFDPGPYVQARASGEHWLADVTISTERKHRAVSGYTAQANITGRISLSPHTFAGLGVYRSQYGTTFADGSGWSKAVTVPQAEVGWRSAGGEASASYQRGPSHWGYYSVVGLRAMALLGRHTALQWDLRYSDGYAGRVGIGYRW